MIQRGVITTDELGRKMEELRARLGERADSWPEDPCRK
jgi:hypothetical protein